MKDKPLFDLAKSLKSACDEHDWEGLNSLDKQVRSLIEQAVESPRTEKENAQLMTFLKRMQKIYQLVIADSERHRDEIASELKKLSRDQKAVNSYLDSSIL